jgi:hypothetical protein
MVCRITLPSLIFALLFASLASAEEQQQDLVKLEHQWAEAYKHHDDEWFRNNLSDNFIFSDWDGQLYNKKNYIAGLNQQELTYYKFESIATRLSGDTGVVTVHAYWKYEDGKGTTGDFRSTDVFQKQAGRWRPIASQDTRIAK